MSEDDKPQYVKLSKADEEWLSKEGPLRIHVVKYVNSPPIITESRDGNTIGQVTNVPAPGNAVNEANLPLKVENDEEKGWLAQGWDSIQWVGGKIADAAVWVVDNPLEATHWGLDGIGLVPGFGEIADGINGVIYTIEGRGVEAGLSFTAMIPFAGWGATTAKTTYKTVGKETVEVVSGKATKEAVEKVSEKVTKEAIQQAQKKLDDAYDAVKSSVQKRIDAKAARDKAKKDLEKLEKKGGDTKEAQKKFDDAQKKYDDAEKAATEANTKAIEAEKKLSGEGGKVNKANKKPHKDCGKSGKYKDMKKLTDYSNSFDGIGLNPDHIPSGEAMRKFAMDKIKGIKDFDKLNDDQIKSILNNVYNNAPTINTPADSHRQSSNTFGGRNDEILSTNDSKNLKGAFKRDTDSIKKDMKAKNDGCLDAYEKSVKELMNFDYDKNVMDSINEAIKKLKL